MTSDPRLCRIVEFFFSVRARGALHSGTRQARSRRLLLGFVCLLLSSCARQPAKAQIVEVTRIVEATQAFPPQLTPAPKAAGMLFPAECLAPEPGVDYGLYSMHNIDMIGWCSFVEPSPDGRYLAYSTMTCQSGPKPGLCGEVVKVLELNSVEAELAHFVDPEAKRLVHGLQWSAADDLVIIRVDINKAVDTWVISWPPPSTTAIIPGGVQQWNDSRTAFYTFLSSGPGACGGLVSGYDFSSKKPFPEIATILGVDRLSAEVFTNTWWDGGSSILLEITPMTYDEERQDDKFLPTIAAKVTLTTTGPEFALLASSPTEDSSFVLSADTGYAIKANPYQARYCLDELDK